MATTEQRTQDFKQLTIKDQESAVTLCKSLIEMKLESLDSMDEIIDRW